MSIEQTWGNFFKSEVKTSGIKLFVQEKISLTSGSDTDIQAFVKNAPPFRVKLASEDISSTSFTADCSCPASRKSQLCKHVWATLLCVEQKYPDFLSAKQVIEKSSASSQVSLGADKRASYQETAKLRASEYRKQQYQKHKLRAKERKRGQREQVHSVEERMTFPAPVEAVLSYFSENGFPMPAGPTESLIGDAKRMLSRVFHPDKGGSHQEVIQLNENCEKLLRFLRGQPTQNG